MPVSEPPVTGSAPGSQNTVPDRRRRRGLPGDRRRRRHARHRGTEGRARHGGRWRLPGDRRRRRDARHRGAERRARHGGRWRLPGDRRRRRDARGGLVRVAHGDRQCAPGDEHDVPFAGLGDVGVARRQEVVRHGAGTDERRHVGSRRERARGRRRVVVLEEVDVRGGDGRRVSARGRVESAGAVVAAVGHRQRRRRDRRGDERRRARSERSGTASRGDRSPDRRRSCRPPC